MSPLRQASNNEAAADLYERPTAMKSTYDEASSQYQRSVYKATVVGVDPGKDVAVLKVEAPDNVLYPIDVGTSTGLKVGQLALAIGNPFGLDHTLTVGVISGLGREVKSPIGRPITNVIQSDAAINPGMTFPRCSASTDSFVSKQLTRLSFNLKATRVGRS